MLQVLRKGLQDIVVEEVPESVLKRGEVKIRTAYSLISSGTELAGLHVNGVLRKVIGERDRIGRIIERAVRSQGIRNTAEAILDKFSEITITGYAGAGIVVDRAGDVADLGIGNPVAYGGTTTGHAEIVCAPRNLVAPVPEGVGLKQATLSTVGSIALHAVRNANLSIGDSVAVIGLGLIGQLAAQLARHAGARVFGIDISPERLDQASRSSLESAFNASDNPADIVRRTGGTGFDRVIVCASSQTSRPMELALSTVRSRGVVVVVGMIRIAIPWEEAYRKEVQVMVSRAYGPGSYDAAYEQGGSDYPIDYVRWTENRNMSEFLRLVQVGAVKTDAVLTHEYPVTEAPEAYRRLAEGKGGIIGAVLSYGRGADDPAAGRTRLDLGPAGSVQSRRSQVSAGHPLRVGMIGLGNIAGWVHLPNVRKHPGLTLHGVCTPKGYRAKHLGRRFGSSYCTTDPGEIIGDRDVDVVFICTRNNTHSALAVEALNAGKHVFVEKPAALTREACSRICDAVEKTGLAFMVNYNRRFSPLYAEVRSHFRNVRPKHISARMNSPDMRGDYWMMNPEEGGGAVIGEGCHFFDLLCWFTGSDPVSVHAGSLKDPQDLQATRNNLSCTMTFEDGSIGTLAYMTVGNRELGSERVELSGGGKSAVIEDIRKMKIWDGPSGRARSGLWPQKGYYEILDDFVRGIAAGRSFLEEARTGARATLCALAALKSAETRVPEMVEKL